MAAFIRPPQPQPAGARQKIEFCSTSWQYMKGAVHPVFDTRNPGQYVRAKSVRRCVELCVSIPVLSCLSEYEWIKMVQGTAAPWTLSDAHHDSDQLLQRCHTWISSE